MIIMIYKTDKDDVMVKMMVMIVIMVILMLLTAFFEHSAISLPRLSRVVQWGSVEGSNL